MRPPQKKIPAIGDSVDEGGEVKFKNPSVEVNVNYILDKRNESGLGTKIGKIGEVWRSDKVGQIYRDNFFYAEPDFGWIDGIQGAERIKSRVSGVGVKIIKNNGDPIVAGKKGITWKDLRENPSWVNNTQRNLKKEKEIRIQRVPYYEVKGENGNTQIIDLSENTCIVNIGDTKSGKGVNTYLVVGFARGGGKKDNGNRYRLSWKNVGNDFLIHGYGCKNLKRWKDQELKLRTDWSWTTDNGKWFDREDSMIVLGNDEGILQIGGSREKPVVAVVLGLIYNKVLIDKRDRTREKSNTSSGGINWDKVLDDTNEYWKKRPWIEDTKDCFTKSNKGIKAKFIKSCLEKENRLDAFKGWKANLKLTYSYGLEQ